jgi:GNAT superfamily N-acetyltransferase
MSSSSPQHLEKSYNPQIRNACIKDTPHIQHLLSQLGYPLTEATTENRITLYTSSPNFALFIAEISNQIVGLIALSLRDLFIVPTKKCCIEAIVIDEEYRGQGIGQKLMAIAEDYARSRECGVIELTSGLRRAKDGTHDFYKKLGYQNDGYYAKLYLRKELG